MMMKTILETNRLYLRELTKEDAIHFYQINNDQKVIAYTGDSSFDSVEDAQEFLQFYIQQYQDHNMGRWAVCLKETDEVLGWCGLKFHPEDCLVDIGYRFYREHWGKGFATEACKACLAYGFKHLDLKRIVAHVHVDNAGSHRVALKSGLIYVKDFIYDGQPAKLYQLRKNEYLSNS